MQCQVGGSIVKQFRAVRMAAVYAGGARLKFRVAGSRSVQSIAFMNGSSVLNLHTCVKTYCFAIAASVLLAEWIRLRLIVGCEGPAETHGGPCWNIGA